MRGKERIHGKLCIHAGVRCVGMHEASVTLYRVEGCHEESNSILMMIVNDVYAGNNIYIGSCVYMRVSGVWVRPEGG